MSISDRRGRQQDRDRHRYRRRADRQRRRKPDDAGAPRAPRIPFIRHTKSLRRKRKHGQSAKSILTRRLSAHSERSPLQSGPPLPSFRVGVSGEMQCNEFSKISRRTMGSKSSSQSKGRPAPNAWPSASAASGPISLWTMMAAAFAMRAWACPLVRATIRMVLNFQAPCPICRSLPVIDDCLQRWCSVARS